MTGAVRLREVIEADLPIFYEHQLDPDAIRMADFPSRSQDAFIAHWGKTLADATIGKQTILVDEQVAGNIVSFEQDGQREVGYWIGRDYWTRGVATRALAAFLAHETVRPLYAYVAKHNIGSRTEKSFYDALYSHTRAAHASLADDGSRRVRLAGRRRGAQRRHQRN